jgi:hypothetical protein
MRREDLLHLQETAAASGVDPTIIRVTGASRLEE